MALWLKGRYFILIGTKFVVHFLNNLQETQLTMPTVYFVDADGNQFEADVEAGTNVMEAAVDNFIDGIVGVVVKRQVFYPNWHKICCSLFK